MKRKKICRKKKENTFLKKEVCANACWLSDSINYFLLLTIISYYLLLFAIICYQLNLASMRNEDILFKTTG